MGKLQYYSSLQEKKKSFNLLGGNAEFFVIDEASKFKKWYNAMTREIKAQPLGNFFRGVGEARFKLYNSAQRFWIENNLSQVEALSQKIPYIDMIANMIDNARDHEVFKRVFDYYGLDRNQTDLPILSILQHYGAPTPLMDWTYNIDVALFFAVEKSKHFEKAGRIEDYLSICRIVRDKSAPFIASNLQNVSGNVFPTITFLANNYPDKVHYISDFEVKNERQIKPLTTYYNLNIMPQEGLFILNPHGTDPLEKIATQKHPQRCRIICYNINKDLGELIRLYISKNKVTDSFIYPELRRYAGTILSEYLKGLV